MMVAEGLTKRLSKLEAAKALEVSPTTVDRMIARGELQTEREPRGTRYKVWVLLPDDESVTPSGEPVEQSEDEPGDKSRDAPSVTKDESDIEELIRLRLQVKNIEDLATYRGELLNEAGRREQLLLDQLAASQKNLETVTLALNPGQKPVEKRRRGWWPWWRRNGEKSNL